jgi:transketolase
VRQRFIDTAIQLLDDEPRTAVVLADISADAFAAAAKEHPDRVINVGIREQLMIGVAGGLALTGLRPIAHSYAPFLVERTYEQVKLDLGHQGVGAILVSIGASYDEPRYGGTHFSPADVALIDTFGPQWTVHVPGHADEVPALLQRAAQHDDPVYIRLSKQVNESPYGTDGRAHAIRTGAVATIVAVGPMLDPVLAATEGLDVTVAYTNTPRPFDTAGLRAMRNENMVLVEPYLAGTSARIAGAALIDVPHRMLNLGVGRVDLHRYGEPADHAQWHGLDPAALRTAISTFIESGATARG